VRPRRLSGVVVRPLNFTVRGRNPSVIPEGIRNLEARAENPSFDVAVRCRPVASLDASSNNRSRGP
jgi:hypothetical protein